MPGSDPTAFLQTLSRLYQLWRPRWQMNARRGFGDATLDLMPFVGESTERFALRQDRAPYNNFMDAHASAVTGQLRAQGAPEPNDLSRFSMGVLGKIRPQEEIPENAADYGELIYYSVDAVDNSGTEWPVYWDGVDMRAQHVGARIMMVETPPRGIIRPGQGTVEEALPSREDFLAGLRPYAVEFDPSQMPFHVTLAGRREFCVLRVPVDAGKVLDGKWVEPSETDETGAGLGYYLLVRRGCVLLGSQYERGGYWLWNADRKLLRTGLFKSGEIPLWYHYGEKSPGTPDKPAEFKSATEGLGRVAVGLMDCCSARDWDAFDAARSGKWFSPASKNVMQAIKEQWDAKSLHIGVPLNIDDEGGSTSGIVVQLLDDSAGAVAPGVFAAIVLAKYQEAREQSYQALTSSPDASGRSKEAGYQEVKQPYLSRRASYRQQSETNAIRAFEQRMGQVPSGFCAYLRKYNLTPVTDEIERSFKLLRDNVLSAPTLEAEMAVSAIKGRVGTLPRAPADSTDTTPRQTPEEYEATIRAELQDSATQRDQQALQAASLAASFTAPPQDAVPTGA